MRKKYPSQEKYEKNNPTITFRMTKEEKEKILQMTAQSTDSVSNLVRKALLGLAKDLDYIHQTGYDHGLTNGKRMGKEEGLTEGKVKYRIWVYCHYCKKPIYIEPNSERHNKIIYGMKDQISHFPEDCPRE
ncbi:Uncharacterised protein [uncultured archaeon]|nr:Uncharacterised protein [uncultured archaeon]